MTKIAHKIAFAMVLSAQLVVAQVSVGGHTVFSLVSRTSGVTDIIANNTTTQTTQSDWSGVSMLRIFPMFRWDVSEKLSVDVRPFIGIDGSSGASPVFGKAIGDQKPKKTEVKFDEFARASVKAILSPSSEISVGYVHPRFTWEYGTDLFWEDVINGSKYAIDPWTGLFPDAGLEYVRTFEFGDALSMPTYIYLITGSSRDVKEQTPTFMAHIEPDLGHLKFHLSGAGGLWNSEDQKRMGRAAAGVSYTHGAWAARAEGSFGWWQDRIANSYDDAIAHGGYLKLTYRHNKVLRTTLGGSFLYHNFINTYAPQPGEEVYASITPAVQVFTSESSKLIFQLDLTNGVQNPWKSPGLSNTLLFAQGTIGWRLTF
jgi:hypothetical protein